MGGIDKCSCNNPEHYRAVRWTLTMTFVPAVIIFIFLMLRGMSPWPSAGLTLALIGGLTLLVKGRTAWVGPALKGALEAAHRDGTVIGEEANQQAVITDLSSINDGRRRS